MSTNLTPWNGLDVEKLKVWVHHILPLVYDDSLSYYEVLAKVGAKMNEVIEGLNANNEQVEKVTGFTIEQVQNLTVAFNNFQQSMITRQENFENTLHQDVNTWENQIEGDIANWKAETEEEFNEQYQNFLEQYRRQFGVVQTIGDSTENVMSQKAVTDTTLVYRGLRNGTDDIPVDLNTLMQIGYCNVTGNVTNAPADVPSSDANVTIVTLPFGTVGLLQCAISSATYYTRWYYASWSKWSKMLPTDSIVQTIGDSTENVMSQKAVTDTTLVYRGLRKGYEDTPIDLNTLMQIGYCNVTGNVTNAPADVPSSDANVTIVTLPFGTVGLLQCAISSATYYTRWYYASWSKWSKMLPTDSVVQTIGDSMENVMSQKAVTDTTLVYRGLRNGTDDIPVDLNTLNLPGYYNVVGNMTNAPTDALNPTFGVPLVTLPLGTIGLLQYAYIYSTTSSNLKVYARYYSGVWNHWVEMMTKDDPEILKIKDYVTAVNYDLQYANLLGHTNVNKVKLKECQGHKVIVRGDSYATVETWGNAIGNALGALETKIIASSGAPLTTILENLDIDNYDDVKTVFIEGGINDCNMKIDLTSFKQKLQEFCTQFKEQHPDIHIVFISPPKYWFKTQYDNGDKYAQENIAKYSAIMCNTAISNGYSIINGFECPVGFCDSELIDKNMSDGIHVSGEALQAWTNTIVSNII